MNKFLVFFTVVMASFSTFAGLPDRHACQERIALAEQSIVVLKDRFNVGEVSHTDLFEAKLNLLDTQLECAAITRNQYCQPETFELIDGILQAVQEEFHRGYRDSSEVQKVQLRKVAIVDICR